jgi:hypothetical protein
MLQGGGQALLGLYLADRSPLKWRVIVSQSPPKGVSYVQFTTVVVVVVVEPVAATFMVMDFHPIPSRFSSAQIHPTRQCNDVVP